MMSKLKIALVILHADPSRGGAERYTHDLAAALVAEGHTVSLVASSFAPVAQAAREVVLPVQGQTRVGRYASFLDLLDAHLDLERYDIVHAMLPVRRCDIYHPHAGIAQQVVAFDSMRSWLANRLNARRNRFAAVERELLAGASPPVVLCLSEYVKKSLLTFYPLPTDRTATLFNAVDLNRFNNQTHLGGGGGGGALMIAQDFARKGLHEAISALARVPDLILTVVGGDRQRRYRLLAQSMGIADRVRFIGPTTDPISFYQAADFFVLPTRHDPCSLVVLESLAMGVPVISTRFNGACEIMQSGVHGFVLDDPADIPALADAMRSMQDRFRQQEMSRACVLLRPALSYQTHLQKLGSIYGGIFALKRSRSSAPDCAS